LINH